MHASMRSWLLWLLLIAIATPAAAREPALNTLRAVDYATLPSGRIVIRATFDRDLERPPGVFRTYHPQVYLVLDFPSTASAIEDDTRKVAFCGVRAIKVMQVGDLTRLAVHLDEPRIGELALKGRELWLTLTPFEIPRREKETWFSRP